MYKALQPFYLGARPPLFVVLYLFVVSLHLFVVALSRF